MSTLTRRQFLSAAALASGAASCGSTSAILPASAPNAAALDACPTAEPKHLSILTWNIFMMPPWVCESPRNNPRAAAIAATLLDRDYDILCLQKVFDGSAREVLETALAERYPYRYGPANDSCSFKLNSGVWVLSRYPLTDHQEITFEPCDWIECLSRKGAIGLSGTCGKNPFRLVATHLQGEEGPSFTPHNQHIRNQQMRDIYDRLVAPHLEWSVPFIVCGDFGTPRFTDDHRSETKSYRRMLATFGADNGRDARITLDDSTANQLAIDHTGRKNELDYILVRENGCDLDVERSQQIFRRGGWDAPPGTRSDLSYRYAVSAKVTFPSRRAR